MGLTVAAYFAGSLATLNLFGAARHAWFTTLPGAPAELRRLASALAIVHLFTAVRLAYAQQQLLTRRSTVLKGRH